MRFLYNFLIISCWRISGCNERELGTGSVLNQIFHSLKKHFCVSGFLRKVLRECRRRVQNSAELKKQKLKLKFPVWRNFRVSQRKWLDNVLYEVYCSFFSFFFVLITLFIRRSAFFVAEQEVSRPFSLLMEDGTENCPGWNSSWHLKVRKAHLTIELFIATFPAPMSAVDILQNNLYCFIYLFIRQLANILY